MPDRNSTQIRQALEDGLAWTHVNRVDLLSREEQRLRAEDVTRAQDILRGWREREEAEAVGTND
jgi:hypothetical protein